MRTPTKVKRKDSTPDEHEEHVLSSLLQSCNEDGRSRVLSKFAEHECEKVDRAVELVLKYQERVKKYDSRKNVKSDLNDEEIEQLYIDRLDAGLYTLQRIVLILADVCVNGSSVCRTRALKFGSILLQILEEYEINLGAEAEEERKRVRLLMARLSSLEKTQT
ncbi:unnamed protein product [Enterobius vermicularis]|uniref:DUF1716 domain-containing protein n=1 Tax=Enterobius vermicularis TaxID=51028 RepID=A0A0N4VIT6_ENTVE|nr:unnamed protein product [Enterobius vermicularis]